MCGNGHHGHASHDVQADDTIQITISPEGVIELVTGQMTTSHATVLDAIAAFARACECSFEESARVVRGVVAQHEHQHEHQHVHERTRQR